MRAITNLGIAVGVLSIIAVAFAAGLFLPDLARREAGHAKATSAIVLRP